MKRLFASILCAFVIVLSSNAYSQNVDTKFGKISMDEMKMTRYENDTSASAVILFDKARTYFTYDNIRGFQINFEHHRRIKILDKNGYDWGNFSITLYNHGYYDEKVSGIKAFTYNLENGKIEKSKLSSSDKFNEEVSEYRDRVKFSMPNVKVGSVIEYKYTFVTNHPMHYPDWQFQYGIPVEWSEYLFEIPEYYFYNKTLKGYVPLHINEEKSMGDKLTVVNKERSGGGMNSVTTTKRYENTLTFTKSVNRMVMKDVPAFQEEAYSTTSRNYLARIEFELSNTKFPGEGVRNYMDTWENIMEKLEKHEYFGLQYNNKDLLIGGSAFVKDEIETIKSLYQKPEDRMKAVFDFVKKNMKWNEKNRLYVDKTIRKAYKENSGNSADINLLMVLMLRECGMNALPVILSTRGNGIIHPSHPSLSWLNYTIACVKIGNKQYLLDATNDYLPMNMLPFKCLNGKGKIVAEHNDEWVDLYNNEVTQGTYMLDAKLGEDGVLTGTLQGKENNYAAFYSRRKIVNAVSHDDYIKEFEDEINGLKVNTYEFTNLKDVYKPFLEKYDITLESVAESLGEMIYFSPVIFDEIETNPLKLEERKYPVDFGYKRNNLYIYKYTIPEGYTIDEQPENATIMLPEKAAIYKYSISVIGNTVQVMSQLSINRPVFVPEDYKNLKDFYNQVIAKQKEQIVLKKQ